MKKLLLMIAVVLCLSLTQLNCNLISSAIPEIPLTISLHSGTIQPTLIPWDQPVTRELALPQTCGQLNLEDLKNRAKEEVQKLSIGADMIAKIIENVEIENLWFHSLSIVIIEGDMPNITSASINLKVGNGEINLSKFQVDSANRTLTLSGNDKIDLLPYIKDFSDGGCIEGTLYITTTGAIENPVKYEIKVKLSVKLKV